MMRIKTILLALMVSLQLQAATEQVELSALPKPPAGQAMYIVVLRRGDSLVVPGGAGLRHEPDFAAVGGQLYAEWDTRRVVALPEAALARLLGDPSVKYIQRIYGVEDIGRAQSGVQANSILRLPPKIDAVPPTWFSGKYLYDSSGNIKAIGVTGSLNGDGKANSYFYDPLGRLVSATANYGTNNSETYTYDAFGNMTSKTTTISGVTESATIGVDAATNRLTLGSYDAAGSYENDGGANWYIHDSSGLIRERVTPSRAEAYLYTADDERIGTDTGDKVTFTVRGFDGKVLSEYEQPVTWNSALWVQDYIYRDGQLVASERVQAEGGIRHFHLDHLGTPRLITNATAQKIAADDYLPFGREVTSWRQEMTDFDIDRPEHFHFTGHERDFGNNIYELHENYLDYMHARYYEAREGRFLEVDPVLGSPFLSQSWNRYSYTRNNPMRYTDPDGRNIYDYLEGVANGWSSSNILNANRVEPRNDDYAFGQAVGDRIAVATGTYEMIYGGTGLLAEGGVEALSGGVATPAVAVPAALSLGVAVHGSVTVDRARKNIAGDSVHLSSSVNKMNKEIRTGQAPGEVKRADKGKVKGEQDHVHFNDKNKSALNEDGTWKHGGAVLKQKTLEWLEKFGWVLPK